MRLQELNDPAADSSIMDDLTILVGTDVGINSHLVADLQNSHTAVVLAAQHGGVHHLRQVVDAVLVALHFATGIVQQERLDFLVDLEEVLDSGDRSTFSGIAFLGGVV